MLSSDTIREQSDTSFATMEAGLTRLRALIEQPQRYDPYLERTIHHMINALHALDRRCFALEIALADARRELREVRR